MHELKTVYLRNLPDRPKSKTSFIRLLLKHINPSNAYATDPTLSLPLNETLGNLDLKLLDEDHKIVSISISTSVRLRNQAFLTFMSKEFAENFLQNFQTCLIMKGRKIDIQLANNDSLLGLALEDTAALEKALKTRKNKKVLNQDSTLKEQATLKRRIRRLRCKLRAKGVDEETIKKVSEEMISTKDLSSENLKHEKTTKKTKLMQEYKNVVRTTIENPPNKVLLLQNLPEDIDKEELTEAFNDENLAEIRLVNIRNVAFVEYRSIEDAKRIKDRMDSIYTIRDKVVSIGFAK